MILYPSTTLHRVDPVTRGTTLSVGYRVSSVMLVNEKFCSILKQPDAPSLPKTVKLLSLTFLKALPIVSKVGRIQETGDRETGDRR